MILTMLFIGAGMVASWRIPRTRGHSSTSRHPDPDSGGNPSREPQADHIASVSPDSTRAGTVSGQCVRVAALHLDDCAAAGGLGNVAAGHYPIVMVGALHLPPILPASPALYVFLRRLHTILALVLFATVLAHMGGVLFHTLIVRDRLLNRMALWPTRRLSPDAMPVQKSPVPKIAEEFSPSGAIAAAPNPAPAEPAVLMPTSAVTSAAETLVDSQSAPAPEPKESSAGRGDATAASRTHGAPESAPNVGSSSLPGGSKPKE